jgi:hypothetical protein
LLVNFILSSTDFNQAWIDNKVKNQGTLGILYFTLFCMITTACGLPRQLAAFLGGYEYKRTLSNVEMIKRKTLKPIFQKDNTSTPLPASEKIIICGR